MSPSSRGRLIRCFSRRNRHRQVDAGSLKFTVDRAAAGPFVALPLPGIPGAARGALWLREGAFTGATHDRPGALELASGGTLFLDELGHASAKLQQSLLTVLESERVQRLGESRPRRVSVRYVFATSSDLLAQVQRGAFLSELYFRVQGFRICLPPLRDRREDILPLAERFVVNALRELEKPPRFLISPSLAEYMRMAPWPGNIRELKSVCQYLAVRARPDVTLDCSHLPAPGESGCTCGEGPAARALEVLARFDGNKAKTARELCLSRGALYRLLARAGEPESGHP
ncbi:MAG: sigma-54-dependent Fis family transcriptional regulator [Gemmatimonadetes bacterium]|nr:sigma-54-dependent Fis family transcriptional regulator [Gemmatimonadota bacterium]